MEKINVRHTTLFMMGHAQLHGSWSQKDVPRGTTFHGLGPLQGQEEALATASIEAVQDKLVNFMGGN